MTEKNKDVASMSYEQARDELVKVVAELEAGSATLETSMQLWERGEALADKCEQWLSGARWCDGASSSSGTARRL